MLDGITRHVVGEGFSKKMRDIRLEFLSKQEFQNKSSPFLVAKDLDEVRRDVVS